MTLVLFTYSGALSAPFLWDDHLLVVKEALNSERSWLDHLLQPFWRQNEGGYGHQIYFRPLTMVSFSLDAAWSGNNPVGYHATNVVLHALVVVELYWLARLLGAELGPALLAAFIFGVAPRLTQSVTWISGRTDVLAAAFGLLALCCYPLNAARARRARAWSRRALAAICLVLGMAAKEVALAFAAVLVIDELIGWRRHGKLRRCLANLGPLAIALGGYAGWRSTVLDIPGGALPIEAQPRALIALEALGRYLWMSVDFLRPRIQLGDVRMLEPRYVGLGVLMLVAVMVLLIRQLRRPPGGRWPPGVWLGLGLAAAGLLPVLHLVRLPVSVVAADRFLYVPWLGIALVVALGLSRISGKRAKLAQGLALVWGLASLIGTLVRNRDYESELRFWLESARTTPVHNTLPQHELAGVFYRHGEYSRALNLYCLVARRNLARFGRTPDALARATDDLSAALSRLGRYREAAAMQERMLRRGLTTPRDVFNSALVQLKLEDFARAEALTRLALRRLPDYPAARAVLQSIPELARERQRLSRLRGNQRLARQAKYYWRLGARPEAEEAYLKLLERGNPSPEHRQEALAFLLTLGTMSGIERALQHGPVEEPELGLLLAERRAFARELQRFQAELAPTTRACDWNELKL